MLISYQPDDRGSVPDWDSYGIFFSLPLRTDLFRGPPSLLSSEYRGLFPVGHSTASHPYVFMAWCLANHRDNFTFITMLHVSPQNESTMGMSFTSSVRLIIALPIG